MAYGGSTLFGGSLLRSRPYLPAGHALAARQVVDPLPAVLRRGLGGVTVPVRPGPRSELYLGGGEPRPGRTLRRLVLAPLLARVRTCGGRLHRDQRTPFRLIVELVGPDRDAGALLRAYRLLDEHLRDHAPMLTRCVGPVLESGAVTVTIAGIVDVRGLLAAEYERYAFADGSFDDLGSWAAPPTLVPVIGESWRRRFGWDGREPISAEERHLLHGLVRAAHDEGRGVRIADLPTGSRRVRRRMFDEVLAAGVDAVADLDQRALAAHLRGSTTPVTVNGMRTDAEPVLTRGGRRRDVRRVT